MARSKFHIVFLVGMLATFCLADDSIDYIPRISYVDGDVSLQERGGTGWTTVDVNLPIQIGDRLVLDRNGLVEIEIDDGSFLRVNQFSELLIQKLEKEKIVIELVRGEIIARTTDNADYIFLTAAGDVMLRSEGLYRINAKDDKSVELIVRSGKARFVNDKLDKKMGRNERIVVYGSSDQFVLGAGDRFDDFDNWSDRRDSRYASTRETSRYIPDTVHAGASDLDLYGRWVFVADYGHCWIPTVYYSGWAPYRSGYWRYSPYWGYTWISFDPWGWLPYHYGSWAYTGSFGWAWVPGSYWGCSWWSPGVVHWGYYNGYVGWVPCGPGDYYYGYWKGGHNTYINNGVINNYYGSANTRHSNAVTYVTEDEFRRGRPVGNGVYNRSTVGRSVQRQDSGVNFRADESVTRELFRRDRVVAGQPKVDPVRTAESNYSRSRAGGADGSAGISVYRNATGESNSSITGRSRDVVAGEPRSGSGSTASSGRGSSEYRVDSGSVNRGRPDVSRSNVQDRSRSRQAEDATTGSTSYRQDSGSGASSGSSISSGSSRSGTTRGSTSVGRSSTGSSSGSSSSSRSSSTPRSVDRPSSGSSSSSRPANPPPTRSAPTRERKVPSPGDAYSRVFPSSSRSSDDAAYSSAAASTAASNSNTSLSRSSSTGDSPAYSSNSSQGRGYNSSSVYGSARPSSATSSQSYSSGSAPRSYSAPSVTSVSSGSSSRSSFSSGGNTRSSISSAPSRSSVTASAPSRSSGSSAPSVSRSSSPSPSSGGSRSSGGNSSSGGRKR